MIDQPIEELQIRYQLGKYILREMPLYELREFLVDSAWDCRSGSAEERLMGEIELLSTELSSGHMEEEDFRARLLPLAGTLKTSSGAL